MSRPGPTRGLTVPQGFRAAAVTCGIKPSGQPDLALIVADGPCTAAGVFTRNKVPGAPVTVCKRHLRGGAAQAIVCNSGVANVATGHPGIDNALRMAGWVGEAIGGKRQLVLPCSTGVIGAPLPIDKIESGIAAAAQKLSRGPKADAAAADAICTTDLVTKAAQRKLSIGGATVRLGAAAKGSGMIAPNMATMLVFITTDTAVTAPLLRAALKQAVNADASFNRITVDDDTSTSDSVLVLAGGAAGNRSITRPGKAFNRFAAALTDLCVDLAYQIVADAEGATKVFRVVVRGARSARDADRVGKTVAASPLVKTAVHGGDPNWGRLAMAVGRSGAAVDPERLSLAIGGVPVMRRGVNVPAPVAKLETHMRSREVRFDIDLALGSAACQWLGCDLSRQYIAINADYTT